MAFYLGEPDAPVVYTPEGAHALASEARMVATLQKAMQSMAENIIEKVTGKIPKPNGPQRFPLEEVLGGLAAILATYKGVGYAAGKIKEAKAKNGNGSG